MSINDGIMWVMGIGFLLGGLDYMTGSRFGLGKKFREGLDFMGVATVTMAGIMCFVPLFSAAIRSILNRLPHFGIDPAMIACVIGINMGGHSLAVELAEDPLIGSFGGVIAASMLGATISFTIPNGLAMIEKEDRRYFAKGLIIGLITIPVGCFAGGLLMGIPVSNILLNEIPVILMAFFLILGLSLIPEKMTAGFVRVGRGIQLISLAGLCLTGFTYITGFRVVDEIKDLMPVMEIITGMCIVMAGSFVVVELFMRAAGKPLERAGQYVGVNGTAISGMLFSFISLFPAFIMMKDMNPKGKVVCAAFFVGSTCVLGGHLSYAAAECPEYIVPMIAAKMTSAVLGALIALIVERKSD